MPHATPFLWIQHPIADAVTFYTQVFEDGRVVSGPSIGEQMSSATIEVAGQQIQLFNAGPYQELTEAFSLMVTCRTQEEIDHLWGALSEGGTPLQCGWLTDRFGITWQIIPADLSQWLTDPDHGPAVSERMLQMSKIEIGPLLDVMR